MNFTIIPLPFKLFSIFKISVLSDSVFLTSKKFTIINRNDDFVLIVPLTGSYSLHKTFYPLTLIFKRRSNINSFTMKEIVFELTLILWMIIINYFTLSMHFIFIKWTLVDKSLIFLSKNNFSHSLFFAPSPLPLILIKRWNTFILPFSIKKILIPLSKIRITIANNYWSLTMFLKFFKFALINPGLNFIVYFNVFLKKDSIIQSKCIWSILTKY